MLEKASISHSIVLKHMCSVQSCTKNIALWWIVEHQERHNDPEDKGFPGDHAMDRELMPTALWMGMREFGGTWREAIEDNGVNPKGRFQFLRDYKNEAILDVLTCRGSRSSSSHTWKPNWYRSEFVEWAQDVLRSPSLPNLARHDPAMRAEWCGVPNCPYPYATESYHPPPEFLHTGNVMFCRREELTPLVIRRPLLFKGDKSSSKNESKLKTKKRKRGE